jgi:hypothetical protein
MRKLIQKKMRIGLLILSVTFLFFIPGCVTVNKNIVLNKKGKDLFFYGTKKEVKSWLENSDKQIADNETIFLISKTLFDKF